MNPTRPSGLLGSAGTFTLLVVAAFSWFMSLSYSGPTDTLLWALGWVAPFAALLAAVLFLLTLRSLFSASPDSRAGPQAIR
jgi:hypothetical protein